MDQQCKMHVGIHGDKCWTLNGKFHRIGAPAIEYIDGNKTWYQNDKRHRLDGPAIEHPDGRKAWCVDGRCTVDVAEWAAMALKFENIEPTQDAIDDKIMQVMQQDLFE